MNNTVPQNTTTTGTGTGQLDAPTPTPVEAGTSGDPNQLRRLIRRRPLTSFFVLAYAVSWLSWLPYLLSSSGLGLIGLQVPEVLGTTQLIGMLPGAYLGPLTAA